MPAITADLPYAEAQRAIRAGAKRLIPRSKGGRPKSLNPRTHYLRILLTQAEHAAILARLGKRAGRHARRIVLDHIGAALLLVVVALP